MQTKTPSFRELLNIPAQELELLETQLYHCLELVGAARIVKAKLETANRKAAQSARRARERQRSAPLRAVR